jgi:hypothetical protein
MLEPPHKTTPEEKKLSIQYDSKKIILLIDKPLTAVESKIMYGLLNVGVLDSNNHITFCDMIEYDIFIILLDSPILGKSKGMTYLEENLKYMKNHNILYYRTSNHIRKEAVHERMKFLTMVISKVPDTDAFSKLEYLTRLYSEHLPQVHSSARICCEYLSKCLNL